jgi:asparagine synthase (glutamine-hydrolysing)
MCGMAGELAFRGARADERAVARMNEVMIDRGPDGDGLWFEGWVALAHRRLTVIDLSEAGRQPMTDDALGLTAVFNGCIYNHHELRRELSDGYSFTSISDTEVLLKAYDRWGEDFVDHLVGMFAVVIVDRRRQRVVMARDRLGIKPLYLAELPGRLRFASTLPALLAGGGVDTELDDVGLHHYLTWHSIVPAPRTILRGVQKLPAATVRVVEQDGSHRDRVYWRPDYVRDPERSAWSREDWRDAIWSSLRTSVKRRLIADVPVGVLLSGGLDSSLIVALLAEARQTGLQTFSIGFDGAGGEEGDEFVYSDMVARQFGTDHHRLRVDVDQFVPGVGRAVAAMPEPMSSHDVTAFYLLSQEVSQHVKVVQSGQGADEVFAGYGYHQPAAGAPRSAAAEVFVQHFFDRRQAEFTPVLEPDRLVSRDPSLELVLGHLAAPGAETALDAVLRLDTHLLMVDDPVKRLDSMSMAWGLEARVPFLDQDVVALAASCPPELKVDQGGKGILKDIGRQLLPSALIDRPKGYFPVPALKHLDEPFLTMVRDALYAPEAKGRELLRPQYVDALLARPNDERTRTSANSLWVLAVLEMWLQQHGVG